MLLIVAQPRKAPSSLVKYDIGEELFAFLDELGMLGGEFEDVFGIVLEVYVVGVDFEGFAAAEGLGESLVSLVLPTVGVAFDGVS